MILKHKLKILLIYCTIILVLGILYRSTTNNEIIKCIPRTSIIFLKTHKTASSTILNILVRYAKNHNLLLALPKTGNYFGHPEFFNQQMLPKLKPPYTYNILCHHTRFNYDQLENITAEKPLFVTILRDPPQQYESQFSYFKFHKLNVSIEDLAYATKDGLQFYNTRIANKRLGRNQMIFDLGLEEKDFDNPETVLQYVKYLDSKIHLVMILERFYESLVLLRHFLCWDIEDMICLKRNVRTKRIDLEHEVIEGLREMNNADQILYDYFDEKLSEKIKEFGVRKMSYEVKMLKKKLAWLYDSCVEDVVTGPAKFNEHGFTLYGYKLKGGVERYDCPSFVKTELEYTEEFRMKQKKFYEDFSFLK